MSTIDLNSKLITATQAAEEAAQDYRIAALAHEEGTIDSKQLAIASKTLTAAHQRVTDLEASISASAQRDGAQRAAAEAAAAEQEQARVNATLRVLQGAGRRVDEVLASLSTAVEALTAAAAAAGWPPSVQLSRVRLPYIVQRKLASFVDANDIKPVPFFGEDISALTPFLPKPSSD